MKIIYENRGVKNYYMKEDHRNYRHNFCSWEKKAWKKKGLYGIWTLDLCKRCTGITEFKDSNPV